MAPREIVAVQVGAVGNQLGRAWWADAQCEYLLDQDGFGPPEPDGAPRAVCFHQESHGRFVPRCVLADLEPLAWPGGSMAEHALSRCAVCGTGGAGLNWARGYYSEGYELAESVLNVLRGQLEACDHPQAAHLYAAAAGGTGGGMGCLLAQQAPEQWPGLPWVGTVLLPSLVPAYVRNTPQVLYNTVLSLRHLVESCQLLLLNESDRSGVHRDLTQPAADGCTGFGQISRASGCFTAPCRLAPGLGSVEALGEALGVSGRRRFVQASMGVSMLEPLQRAEVTYGAVAVLRGPSGQLPVPAAQLWHDMRDSGCWHPWRDRQLETRLLQQMVLGSYRRGSRLAGMPTALLQRVAAYTQIHTPRACLFSSPVPAAEAMGLLSNSTNVAEYLTELLEQFGVLFKRRAMLMWYTGEGLEMDEIQEAAELLQNVLASYKSDDQLDDSDVPV